MNAAVMPSGVGRSRKWEAALEERERYIVGEEEGRVPFQTGWGSCSVPRAPGYG